MFLPGVSEFWHRAGHGLLEGVLLWAGPFKNKWFGGKSVRMSSCESWALSSRRSRPFSASQLPNVRMKRVSGLQASSQLRSAR